MRWRYVLNVIGLLILFSGLTMLAPLGVGVLFDDASVSPLLISLGIALLRGPALLYHRADALSSPPAPLKKRIDLSRGEVTVLSVRLEGTEGSP